MRPKPLPPIGLIVIGGFLGAGKTTLLNHLLANNQGCRLAVLVNDFGAINIDTALVVSQDGNAIELSNGCVCCSIGDDLTAALIGLIESPAPPERIVIEASGVSDPWRIAQVGLADPALALDSVIVLVDADAFALHAGDPLLADTLGRQLKSADLLVLNHCDRATAQALGDLNRHLDAVLPRTPRIQTRYARVAGMLLGQGVDELDIPGPVQHHLGHACGCKEPHEPHRNSDACGATAHDQLFETCAFQTDQVFRASALRELLRNMPAGVMRLKGFVHTDEHGLAVLQFAGRQGSLRPALTACDKPRGIVAIGLRGKLPQDALETALAQARMHANPQEHISTMDQVAS